MTTLDTKQECAGEHRSWVKIKGRAIGWIEGLIFYKSVIGSKHMLMFPPAWAIQAQAWEQVQHVVHAIEVHDRETGITYRISAADFEQFKVEIDRGWGRQYYVELEHWATGEGSTYGG